MEWCVPVQGGQDLKEERNPAANHWLNNFPFKCCKNNLIFITMSKMKCRIKNNPPEGDTVLSLLAESPTQIHRHTDDVSCVWLTPSAPKISMVPQCWWRRRNIWASGDTAWSDVIMSNINIHDLWSRLQTVRSAAWAAAAHHWLASAPLISSEPRCWTRGSLWSLWPGLLLVLVLLWFWPAKSIQQCSLKSSSTLICSS